ncbi:hypothetical protein BASA81_004953 [Batrachochytrium salamandrivorans]|nr:hypothetical protein BASA81_004953 [Batrachochytrium salamandrivorans]
MASSLSIPECVEFGFYSDEEIRSLSVCKVTEEMTFDSLGHASPNGLYDARMGPTDFDQGLCPTCGNNFSACPGHAGHIELKLPVYHPMLFPQLHKVLNALCFSCHRFRTRDQLESEEFRVRMELLNCGLVRESKEMANELLANSASSSGETMETRFTRREAIVDQYDRLAHETQKRFGGNKPLPTTHFTTARREAISDLIKTCQSAPKCGLCGQAKFKIRKAGNTKLFKSAKDSAEEQFFPPSKALQEIKKLWKNQDRELAKLYLGPDSSKFFCSNLFVPPSRFRPARRTGSGIVIENAQTKLFVNVLASQQLLLARVKQQQEEMEDQEDGSDEDVAERLGQTMRDWSNLQDRVNCLMDDAKAENPVRNASEALPGIRQLMEKKEGLFRQNLMGKRVNFACRSVISPDPMIGTDEIGVPLKFAKILTYAEPVTEFNVKELAQLVINGPDSHPGACYIEDSAGRLIDLKRRNDLQRQELAARLEDMLNMETSKEERELNSRLERAKGGDNGTEASSINRIRSEARAKSHQFGFQTKVWRHLRNGDVMLANRQPTLHKSSIMAHSARVIDNIKMQTIRMHYANCYSYNADFDGDEINLHFPQNELARSEGYEIAYTNHQYCAPTDGVPMRGLIQDHLSMGVLLSKRDTYFDRETFCQLAFSATANLNRTMELPPPAVMSNQHGMKWTGKQLVSLVMRRVVPESCTFCLFNSKSKTPANAFQVHNIPPPAGEEAWSFDGPLSDTKVSFLNGEMIAGILDKNAFGNSSKYGYVHSVFEAYGAKAAGELLSALGRLFTHLERLWGHTCSMDDLVLNADAERTRSEIISQGEMLGVKKSFAFTQGGDETTLFDQVETVRLALSNKIALSSNSKLEEARLDGQMQSVTSKIQSNVMKACVPFGQMKRFPTNSFSLMVMTGAKGSNVNQSQISCMLGQQSLEGRRVPRTAFGKTLPCFDPFDPSPRAGGFVTNRFLSGIRPQEYYFHCMAGREGLLDTAVKTARSGYLQRCMIKHLEHLKVSYDRTVRADDGSIVQFLYGDDGMDAMNVPFVCGSDESLRFLRDNPTSFAVPKDLEQYGFQMLDKKKLKRSRKRQEDPLLASENIDVTFGILPESLDAKVDAFLGKQQQEEGDEEFKRQVQYKFLKSLVAPGEPVGVLAAQGIGEPSTQMTLNTFHLAGHSTTNVTLGIPRLRELLWARAPGKTPTIRLECTTMDQAQHVASRLTRVVLSDLTLCDGGGVVIREVMVRKTSDGREMTGKEFSESGGMDGNQMPGTWSRRYHIRYHLQPLDMIQEEFNITLERIAESVSKRLVSKLIQIIAKEFKRITGVAMKTAATRKSKSGGDEDEDEAPAEEDGALLDDEAMDDGERKSDDEEEEEDEKSIVKKQNKKTSKSKRKKNDDEEEEEEEDGGENNGDAEEKKVDLSEDEEEEAAGASKRVKTSTTTTTTKLEGGLTKVACGSMAPCLRHVAASPNTNTQNAFIEVCLEFPADSRRILLVDICDQLAKECPVRSVEGILDALAVDEDGKFLVMVAGASSNKFNLKTMWKYEHMGNVKTMGSNDVNAVLTTLGVEAARTCLIQQFQAVFDPYGIDIDERHLALVADHMLFEGDFKGLNRHGIQFSTSPFVRITFETAIKFVVEAAMLEDQERLETPSARIATGQVIKSGTGSFGLVVKPVQERTTSKKKLK